MNKLIVHFLAAFFITVLGNKLHAQDSNHRTIISLNGTWQIAEGDSSHIPEKFTHTVQVPGLADMAQPAFKDVGPKVADRRAVVPHPDPLRESFWYKKKFIIGKAIPAVAILKVAKAKYGTKIYLNGKRIAEHLPSFTPGYFNLKGALRTGENELIIRVGANRASLPRSIPDGFDFEKERYIPGIYDNVKLILSGSPHIIRVQTVPDINDKELQVQLSLDTLSKVKSTDIEFIIRDKNTQNVSGRLKMEDVEIPSSGLINVRIPVKDCHLWSPEDPFLYKLIVKTEGDEEEIDFGMREFHFDPITKKGVLNGHPYFLRGTNVTVYRFFEDSLREGLPWDTAWVRNLFRSFKQFHWNSVRLCIGFPPNFWYDIADEEGILLQNEFPVWYGPAGNHKWPKKMMADELAKEYTSMMYEYWNHPSVVIWDASNETASNGGETDRAGKAVWMIRNLDLSNRPWDNSYESHRAPGDVYEVHPYHFSNPKFRLRDISTSSPVPQQGSQILPNTQDFPVIINEYGWLWLNRDGTPTTLTKQVYENLLGPNSTTEERWYLYATYMAAETEFWRCHRKAAGVLIFTALGYSRPDGQTSDFFTNVKNLEYDSSILKYLPDAFSPVGLMLDEWGSEIECNRSHKFDIVAINDLGKNWSGQIQLRILRDNKIIKEKAIVGFIPAYGQRDFKITCNTPKVPGTYVVEAVLLRGKDKPVKSIREIPFNN